MRTEYNCWEPVVKSVGVQLELQRLGCRSAVIGELGFDEETLAGAGLPV